MALLARLEARVAESRALAGRLMEAMVEDLTKTTAALGPSHTNTNSVIHVAKWSAVDPFGNEDHSEQYLRHSGYIACLIISKLGKNCGKI